MDRTWILFALFVAASVTEAVEYKVSSIKSQPFLMQKVGGNEGEYEGYIPDLLEKISEITKDTYKIEVVKDNKYGERNKNGEWQGMIGELIRGDTDIAAAPLTLTAEREKVVDFTKPFMTSGITMLMKKPELGIGKYANAVFLIFKPMTIGAWIMLLIAFLAVAAALYSLNRFHPHEFKMRLHNQGKGTEVEAKKLNIRGSLWVSYRALNLQGVEFTPKSLASRVLFSFWLMFILFTISLYITALVTWWPATAYGFTKLPVASMEELSKQTKIGYGCLSGGSTEAFFKNSKVPVFVRMNQYMSTEPGMMVSSSEQGVKKVRESKKGFVFLMEHSSASYQTKQKPCDLITVGEMIKTISYGLATSKGSTIKDRLNLAVLQLRESGELEIIHQRWWKHKTTCGSDTTHIVGVETSHDKSGEPNSVTATQLGGPFILLVIGFILATITAVVEVFFYKRREKQAAAAEKADEEAGTAGTGGEDEDKAAEDKGDEVEGVTVEEPADEPAAPKGSKCSCFSLPKISLPAFPLRRRGDAATAGGEEEKALKEDEEKPDGDETKIEEEDEKKDEEKKEEEPAKLTREVPTDEKESEEKGTKEAEEKKE